LLAAPAGAQTVAVLEVEHDRVTAGDLARVIPEWSQAPARAEVLYAPLAGVTRELARAEIARLAARYAVACGDPTCWPERIALRRRMRALEKAEAESALVAAVASRYRVPPDDVGLEIIGFREPQVPAGELRFRAGYAFRRSGEVATLPLTWTTPEHRSGTLWVRAQVSIRGRYAVAARAIDLNKKIEPGDVTFSEGELDGPADAKLLAPEHVIGRTLTHAVAAGERIPRAWLIEPKTIERGAVVELRLARGSIELRTPARAEQAGAVGDRVVFRNLDSGRRVAARVADARTAEIVTSTVVSAGGRK
jgi:flagella basal body P-ring formation protein FlgA